MKPQNIHILHNESAFAAAIAAHIAHLSKITIAKQGRFSIALAGGNTPRTVYNLLAHPPFVHLIEWEKCFFFWGDERCVPADHADSNFKMANDTLLSKVNVPEDQIFPMNGAIAPSRAAIEYETTLHQFFGNEPAFDLILLGMGDDGHTASLFPGTDVLHESEKWVKEVYLEKLNTYRITLTAPLINQAKHVAFMVAGAGKAQRIKDVLGPNNTETSFPIQLIQPSNGTIDWFLDQDASRLLIY